jgi:three-Cys-motif partner protein
MPIKNLHAKAFDEGTIVKLELFEEYAKAWLPTFIMSQYKEIWIFDFFAGTGYDIDGNPGSPIRLLQQIKNQIGPIFQHKIRINLCINEFEPKKYQQLVQSCNDYLEKNQDVKRAISIYYKNCDFAELFPKTLSTIQRFPSLVYLDQNGIKFAADKYILELEQTDTTDFLFFISSSYIWRFGDTPAFQDCLHIDMAKAKENPYKYIHTSILEQFKDKLPKETKLTLYPFTIKKGKNIYGIIFGAKHPRAVDKFLKTAWEMNEINGAANFDIDEDNAKQQLDIFEGKRLSKIESFCQKLRAKVLSGELKDNQAVFHFALSEGHLGKHASDEIKRMKKEGLLDYPGKAPLINYEQIYKNQRQVTFTLK